MLKIVIFGKDDSTAGAEMLMFFMRFLLMYVLHCVDEHHKDNHDGFQRWRVWPRVGWVGGAGQKDSNGNVQLPHHHRQHRGLLCNKTLNNEPTFFWPWTNNQIPTNQPTMRKTAMFSFPTISAKIEHLCAGKHKIRLTSSFLVVFYCNCTYSLCLQTI